MYSIFFFNDTATTEIYTLSLHDALPICTSRWSSRKAAIASTPRPTRAPRVSCSDDGSTPSQQLTRAARVDRKSTRLNSSHDQISNAVFCLEKKHRWN